MKPLVSLASIEARPKLQKLSIWIPNFVNCNFKISKKGSTFWFPAWLCLMPMYISISECCSPFEIVSMHCKPMQKKTFMRCNFVLNWMKRLWWWRQKKPASGVFHIFIIKRCKSPVIWTRVYWDKYTTKNVMLLLSWSQICGMH